MARVQNANTNGPCPNWALNTSTNQLTTSPCSYDAAGDLTGDGSYTYSWNAEQHLTSAANVTHTYDGDLRRVKKSSGTLYWYCAVCGNVLAESDLSGNLTSECTFSNKQRIARRDVSSGNVYYLFRDRLGSYRALTDSNGNVQGESDYYPFGGERVISSNVTDNFRFAGMEWDSEDSLNHTLYRQYTSAQGRWETTDPKRGCVNFPQGQNLYGYVRGNPTNAVDPDGRDDPSCSTAFTEDPCDCCANDPTYAAENYDYCCYYCGVCENTGGSGGSVGRGGGGGSCTASQTYFPNPTVAQLHGYPVEQLCKAEGYWPVGSWYGEGDYYACLAQEVAYDTACSAKGNNYKPADPAQNTVTFLYTECCKTDSPPTIPAPTPPPRKPPGRPKHP